ncbi:MAG: hypothetical protein BWY79_01985 [Actinobacteria bacterium ADurb.Bin444]|nr:MAG: hypothetical protein BWY79_01985 [Actinobacteria bacterium ADurb.Bin444]
MDRGWGHHGTVGLGGSRKQVQSGQIQAMVTVGAREKGEAVSRRRSPTVSSARPLVSLAISVDALFSKGFRYPMKWRATAKNMNPSTTSPSAIHQFGCIAA